MRRRVRFIISGATNTLFSYLWFVLVFLNTDSVALALASSLLGGIALSYLLNRFWVWNLKNRNALFHFVSFQLLLMLINWLILHLVAVLGMSRVLFQLALTPLFALLSYFVNKKVFGAV